MKNLINKIFKPTTNRVDFVIKHKEFNLFESKINQLTIVYKDFKYLSPEVKSKIRSEFDVYKEIFDDVFVFILDNASSKDIEFIVTSVDKDSNDSN